MSDFRIYLSYRRTDADYASSVLYDFLSDHFGKEAVFKDIESVPFGADFSTLIKQRIQSANVVIPVIGANWANSRINKPGDFIRFELEYALEQRVPVIPVYVGEGSVPSGNDLPGSLTPLLYCQGFSIDSASQISEKSKELIETLESIRKDPDIGFDLFLPVMPDRYIPPEESLSKEETSKEEQSFLDLSKAEVEPHHKFPYPLEKKEGKEDYPEKDEKSVFISYKRSTGSETARLMRYELLTRDWQVFLDVEDLKAGYFDEAIFAEIEASRSFLLILSEGAFDSIQDKDDWLHKEIMHALRHQCRIVPLYKNEVISLADADLSGELGKLKRMNAIEYSHVYYNATIEKLLSFLEC